MLTWGAYKHINWMLANYDQMYIKPVPKWEVHAALEPGDQNWMTVLSWRDETSNTDDR